MNSPIVDQIIKKYGLTRQAILPPQKGFRNTSYALQCSDKRWLNIIIYKSEPDIVLKIKHANAVSDFLAAKGLSTRETLGRVLRLRKQPLTYCALYTYLPGHTIPWEAYTMQHLKLLGATMSRMHYALEGLQLSTLPNIIDSCIQLVSNMHHYFAQHGVRQAMRNKLQLKITSETFQTAASLLAACRHLPSCQPLHMDFVRGNILFKKQNNQLTVSGILDFEKTAFGPKIFDIARTLAFLLVDCKYKPEQKIRKYFLQSGYNKRGLAVYRKTFLALTDKKVDVLEALVDFFLLHDLYKFLRHNPYENLYQNQHFIATRKLMLQRGLLTNARINNNV